MSTQPSRFLDQERDLPDRYRWRGRRGDPTLQYGRLRLRRRMVWGSLGVGFLGFLTWLVLSLLFAPKRTPLVAVAADVYTNWPFPPNAWAHEDVERFRVLDGKTISFYRESTDVRTSDEIIRQRLRADELRTWTTHSNTIVIYLTMHGVVDDAGKPCLIPPTSSPLEGSPRQLENNQTQRLSGSWLPVETLLRHLCGALPRKNALLILDCNRIDVNWHLG